MPLCTASKYGHVAIVATLLAAPGIDADSVDHAGQCPLHTAAYFGHAAVVTALLA